MRGKSAIETTTVMCSRLYIWQASSGHLREFYVFWYVCLHFLVKPWKLLLGTYVLTAWQSKKKSPLTFVFPEDINSSLLSESSVSVLTICPSPSVFLLQSLLLFIASHLTSSFANDKHKSEL